MKKKFSEMTPAELKKIRITTATGFTLIFIVTQAIMRKGVHLSLIVAGVIAGIGWYLVWLPLTIWLDKKFTKNKDN